MEKSMYRDTPIKRDARSHLLERGNAVRLSKSFPGQIDWELLEPGEKTAPELKLSGECSLKRNTSLGSRALNVAFGDGRQKFTSSTLERLAWCVNQFRSVTPTKIRIWLTDYHSIARTSRSKLNMR
jgi:hypothetical protein